MEWFCLRYFYVCMQNIEFLTKPCLNMPKKDKKKK